MYLYVFIYTNTSISPKLIQVNNISSLVIYFIKFFNFGVMNFVLKESFLKKNKPSKVAAKAGKSKFQWEIMKSLGLSDGVKF
jgi:uncharacterized protein YutD